MILSFLPLQSVISLLDFTVERNPLENSRDATTSIESSIHQVSANKIVPYLVDQLTASSSTSGNAPTQSDMQDFLLNNLTEAPCKRKNDEATEALISQFVNSADTSGTMRVNSNFRLNKNPQNISVQVQESRWEPINTKQTATNTNVDIDFDVSNYINECNRQVNITLQARLDVKIFPPALSVWRLLQTQQGHKVTLELCIAYQEKLISTNHYPEWTVGFHLPTSLLNTQ